MNNDESICTKSHQYYASHLVQCLYSLDFWYHCSINTTQGTWTWWKLLICRTGYGSHDCIDICPFGCKYNADITIYRNYKGWNVKASSYIGLSRCTKHGILYGCGFVLDAVVTFATKIASTETLFNKAIGMLDVLKPAIIFLLVKCMRQAFRPAILMRQAFRPAILRVTDPNTTNEKGGYAALFSTAETCFYIKIGKSTFVSGTDQAHDTISHACVWNCKGEIFWVVQIAMM